MFISPPPEESEAREFQLRKSPYSSNRRTPPPQELETGAAETTYMHRGQMTPVSSPSRSRHASPLNLDGGTSSGGRRERAPSRRNPSEDWVRPKAATLPTSRPGGYGGFGDPMSNTREKQSAGANFMDRINNTIPGPFDAPRRPLAAQDAYPQRKESLDRVTPPPSDEPLPARFAMIDGYKGFGTPSHLKNGHQAASLVRSETYPKAFPSTQSSQMQQNPFVSGPRPDRSRHLGELDHEPKRLMGLNSSSRPPPRTDLLADHESRNAGSIDLAAEFGIKNPYYASMSSVSSGYSDFSVCSHATAQTSLPRSHAYQSNLDQAAGHTRPKGDPMTTSDLRMDAVAANSHRFAPQVMERPCGTSPIKSRVDRVCPGPGSGQHTPAASWGEPRSFPAQDSGGYVYEARRLNTSDEHVHLPWSKRQDPWERQSPRGHVAQPSRGDCRACGVAITGKSISSADGRLTGKYHKACFVCSTCHEPFSSAVFYVLGDKPYCEQDYHRLNNSLCGSCGRGIEGQFAEDEARVKHHLGCFRCLDCGLSLADGYFEVDGYAYCERDAWQRVQAQSYAEQETYQPGPPRGTPGARRMPNGLPARPGPYSGQQRSGRPCLPPPSNTIPYGSRLAPGGAAARLRMNKRMTRLGNMNL
ncbi:hypothetical protein E4U42_001224 [Claviceps africana]|uniref:LIM zinc-binding domain-containing protein n=1 Tax=Claviceps africana TaxID=83212 RepID=A0A8K0IZF8_9HYPO|nr:hypothetical protein E4U42_001224 [Claviceps africana]